MFQASSAENNVALDTNHSNKRLYKMTSSSQGVAICLSHGVGIWPRKEKPPIPFRQKAYNQNNIDRNTGLGFEPLRLTLDCVQKMSLTAH